MIDNPKLINDAAHYRAAADRVCKTASDKVKWGTWRSCMLDKWSQLTPPELYELYDLAIQQEEYSKRMKEMQNGNERD